MSSEGPGKSVNKECLFNTLRLWTKVLSARKEKVVFHRIMPGRNKYLLSEKSNSNMIKKSFSFSLVFDKYMTISGFQIEETIDRETSGNLEQLLLAVGR
jgi:hypothetical protein